ncbi:MAG: AraC family transcriptional regulator [Planctomycetota bacterium]
MTRPIASNSATADPPDRALRTYCAELFAHDQPEIEVIRQPIREVVRIEAHDHASLLQLTWLSGCGGRVMTKDRWEGVTGRSALAAYPGDRHGYELTPLTPDAEAVLIKLSAQRGSSLTRSEPLPDVATSLPESPRLSSAIDRLHRDVAPARESVPQWLADAAAVLTLWPRRSERPTSTTQPEADLAEIDPAVESALSLIESRLDRPPSLAEMAKAAHLSERQFCRRFQRATGRTPHAYFTARRLARAQALLFDERLSATKITQVLGFTSPAVFTRWFRQHQGQTPGEFRSDPTRF